MDNKFQKYINLGVKSNKLFRLLFSTIKIHQGMEKEYINRLKNYINQDSLISNKVQENYIKYLEKNFFSTLLLSIFKINKVSKERIIEYGIIIHSLRGMVTCADNIIDKESKGSIFLNGISNHILSNTMLSIVHQNILNDSINILSHNESHRKAMVEGYSKALYSIALGESIREFTYSIEKPEEIINTIHKKIGGELLELAFIIPSINENSEELQVAKNGIFQIGIALQMLDDICDFKEDISENKKNYLFSKIFHSTPLKISEIIEFSKKENFYKSDIYINNYNEAVKEAIDIALNGFEVLGKSGYPVDNVQGKLILEFMFNVRGLSDAWKNYEKLRKVI